MTEPSPVLSYGPDSRRHTWALRALLGWEIAIWAGLAVAVAGGSALCYKHFSDDRRDVVFKDALLATGILLFLIWIFRDCRKGINKERIGAAQTAIVLTCVGLFLTLGALAVAIGTVLDIASRSSRMIWFVLLSGPMLIVIALLIVTLWVLVQTHKRIREHAAKYPPV